MRVETSIPHLQLFSLLKGLFAPRHEGGCATQRTWKTPLYTPVKSDLKKSAAIKGKKANPSKGASPAPAWCDFGTRKNRRHGKRRTKGTRGQSSRRRGQRELRGTSHPAAPAQPQTQGSAPAAPAQRETPVEHEPTSSDRAVNVKHGILGRAAEDATKQLRGTATPIAIPTPRNAKLGVDSSVF